MIAAAVILLLCITVVLLVVLQLPPIPTGKAKTKHPIYAPDEKVWYITGDIAWAATVRGVGDEAYILGAGGSYYVVPFSQADKTLIAAEG